MGFALTSAESLGRLLTDQLMVGSLDAHPCPISAGGHRSGQDTRESRCPVLSGDGEPPVYYRAACNFPPLKGPGKRTSPTVVHLSSLANGAYPATPPGAWVISETIPWSPHSTAGQAICIGSTTWKPNRSQPGDMDDHVARLLNFDEPPLPPHSGGWNPAAVACWRDTMHLRPLDPPLRLPRVTLEGVIEVRPRFAASAGATPPRPHRSDSSREQKQVRGAFGQAGPTRFAPSKKEKRS